MYRAGVAGNLGNRAEPQRKVAYAGCLPQSAREQRAYFVALHWMHTRRPPLGPANVKAPGSQLDLMPS